MAAKGWIVFLIVVLIIVAVVAVYSIYSKNNEISSLNSNVVNLQQNTSDQIQKLSQSLSDIKNYSQGLKAGSAPFWNENNEMIVGLIPLNSYYAGVIADKAVSSLGNFSNSISKNINETNGEWVVSFVCKNDTNSPVCGSVVTINESARTYSLESVEIP